MEQELPRPQRVVVEAVSLVVGADVHADQKHLAVFNAAEAVLQVDLPLPQGLHFRSRQGDSRFVGFMNKIIVARFAVVRNIFYATR